MLGVTAMTAVSWVVQVRNSDSDLFQTANGFLPGGSITTTIQQTNAQVINKQNKEK
jgi:hypothetical protein